MPGSNGTSGGSSSSGNGAKAGAQPSFPDLKGFSERNIDRMIAFHRGYPIPSEFSPPAVAKMAQASDSLLWSIPWAHHIVLMEKLKDLPTRRWYMEQTLANGWTRNVLAVQIDARPPSGKVPARTRPRVRLRRPAS